MARKPCPGERAAATSDGSSDAPRTPEEWRKIEEVDPEAVADLQRRIVKRVERWDLHTPALILFESAKPVSYIASMAMVFAEPVVDSLFRLPDYYTFRKMLEDRGCLEELIRMVEDLVEERREKRLEERAGARERKRRRREARRRLRSNRRSG
jgi:pilus assembly protein TadC